MADSMYETFSDFSGVNNDTDSGADDTYSIMDENRSRKLAEDAIRRESVNKEASVRQDNSKQFIEEINKLRAEKAQMSAQFESKFNTIQNELSQMKNGYSSIKGDIDTHTERMILEDISKEEQDILNDPAIGSLYDRNEIRRILVNNAQQGRVLNPKEALAIHKFDAMAKELAELKSAVNKRNTFLDSPISGFGAKKAQANTKLANVRGIEDAKELAYEMAKEQLGY